MSLRARIATTAAAAVAVAVLLVAAGVYATTAGRLQAQVDRELETAAEAVLSAVPGDSSLAARLRAFERLREEGRAGPGGAEPAGRRGQDRFLGPLDAGIVQRVSRTGEVTTFGRLRLPVDDATLELAARGFGERRSTVETEGVEVRLLTVGAGNGGALQLGIPINDIAAALVALRQQLLLAGMIGVGLAALLGAAVADRAVRPVRRLTDAAEEVGRTGDLSTRIDVTSDDELGRLAGSFNEMLAGLELARSSQQQLIADASHELRTPLTSLRTNVEVLQLTDKLPPDERRALLGDVTAQLEEFGRLVDGLVELARGDVPAKSPTPVVLAEALSDVVDRAATFAPGVAIVVDADGSVVLAERDRLERALSNLVDNAVKHGGGTPVDITVVDGAVRVRDHGDGIPPEDVGHIFDRFYRAPSARSLPGSGLGLSIVEQVATAHGGTVVARNHPDGGAEIELRLPTV